MDMPDAIPLQLFVVAPQGKLNTLDAVPVDRLHATLLDYLDAAPLDGFDAILLNIIDAPFLGDLDDLHDSHDLCDLDDLQDRMTLEPEYAD